MRLSSKETSRPTHNLAIPGGIDDELVASTIADIKEVDMDYLFLAGKRRTQEMDKWAGGHLSNLEG